MDGWGVQGGAGLLCRAGISIIQQGSAARARVMAAHGAGTGPTPELEELRPVGSWFSALPKVREELQKGGLMALWDSLHLQLQRVKWVRGPQPQLVEAPTLL